MSFSFTIPSPKNIRRLVEIPATSTSRRLIGIHLKANETTVTSWATMIYLMRQEDIIPLAVLATARKNPAGFEVVFGRASGMPYSFSPVFLLSERGVDLPPGESISLWLTHITGDLEIELMWC